MRKALFLLLAILWPEFSAAQESYTLSAGATNVTTLTEVITLLNSETCGRYSLADNCTQAAVCTAATATGGAGCTAAQARAGGVRIYPLTQAGREEFVTFGIALPEFLRLAETAQRVAQKKLFCDSWAVASVANRNTCRTAVAAASNADPCQ